MCDMCDGVSPEESARRFADRIAVHGWTATLVEVERPFIYTTGVLESTGHPDLVICDMETGLMWEVLNAFVDEAFGRSNAADILRAGGVRTRRVHRTQLTGDRFGRWCSWHDRLPVFGEFVQIVPPAQWYCQCHRHTITRLDHPPSRRGRGHAA